MPNPGQDLLSLAPVFMRHPEIACQMDTPRWQGDTEPWQVLAWFLQEYSKLVLPEISFTVERDEATSDLAIVNRQYMGMDDATVYLLPLSFLPELATTNRTLHDLLLETAALLFKLGGLGTWDYDVERVLEYWEEWAFDLEASLAQEEHQDERETLEILTRDTAYYNDVPAQYAQKIHKVAKKASLPRLKKRVLKLQATARDHGAEWASLMMNIIALLESGFNLDNYSSYSEGSEEISLQGFIQLWWSPDDDLTEAHLEGLSNTAGEYGLEMPVTTQTLTAGNTLTLHDFEIDHRFNDLLALIAEWTNLAEMEEQHEVQGAIPPEESTDDLRAAA